MAITTNHYRRFLFEFEDSLVECKTWRKTSSWPCSILEGINSKQSISLLIITSLSFFATTSFCAISISKNPDRNGKDLALFSMHQRNVAQLLRRRQLQVPLLLISVPCPSLTLAFRLSPKYRSPTMST